jgi:predicted O-methyltransferase YrrM
MPMNDVLKEILATNTVRTPRGETLPLKEHIPQLECEVMQTWIAAYRPRRLLEIGLACGVSALFICDALAQTGDLETVTYYVIDPFQHSTWLSVGIRNLDRAGYRGVYTFYEEPSEFCLPRLAAEQVRLDFALIDGFHTFDHTLVDFFYINRLLSIGGIVVFDDIQLPSIQKVVAHVATYECYEILPPPPQLRRSLPARVRRLLNVPEFRLTAFLKTAPDRRRWDWHREF